MEIARNEETREKLQHNLWIIISASCYIVMVLNMEDGRQSLGVMRQPYSPWRRSLHRATGDFEFQEQTPS